MNVLSVTTPIFLLIALGFFATRAEWISQSETLATHDRKRHLETT